MLSLQIFVDTPRREIHRHWQRLQSTKHERETFKLLLNKIKQKPKTDEIKEKKNNMAEDFDIEALLEAPYNVSTPSKRKRRKISICHWSEKKEHNFRYTISIHSVNIEMSKK